MLKCFTVNVIFYEYINQSQVIKHRECSINILKMSRTLTKSLYDYIKQ